MKVVIVGAGMIGLCTAMLLAHDGHEVTVLERDAAEPPDPCEAWEGWTRRGVGQFRLPHSFLARFRQTVEAEMPELAQAFTAAGATRIRTVGQIPDQLKGGARPGDDRFDVLTGRRCVMEAAAARTAAGTKGVDIRRGTAVAALTTGPHRTAGHGPTGHAANGTGNGTATTAVPHVTGVELETGERIAADLVIDAAGRRSPLPRWLDAIGAAPCAETVEDSGFMYFGRHFRSADGTLPAHMGPPKQDYGSITCLTLAADNGTWSVVVCASAKDTALRAARDADTWARIVRTLPLQSHWIDPDSSGAQPIDDGVQIMAAIEDRIRDLAPGGRPVATGVINVADAWSCTNPSLGRGASIGITHAVALRDLLRDDDATADPYRLATAWSQATAGTVLPWFEATRSYDRHRLAEIDALIDGRPFYTDDPQWHLVRSAERLAMADGDILRANVAMAMTLEHPETRVADTVLQDKLAAARQAFADQPRLGPSRSELLATLAG